jgi:outer membrane protein OmpA-like peptidoglycan-associated protein
VKQLIEQYRLSCLWVLYIACLVKVPLCAYAVAEPTYLLSGTVLLKEQAKALPGVRVLLFKVDRSQQSIRYYINQAAHATETNKKGAFSFTARADAEYELHVLTEEYTPAFAPVHLKPRNKVKAGEHIRLDLLMLKSPINLVKGQVLDANTRNALPGSVVSLYNITDHHVYELPTDQKGKFIFPFRPQQPYMLAGSHTAYFYSTSPLYTSADNEEHNLLLQRAIVGQRVQLDTFFFNINSHEYTPAAEVILGQVVRFMHLNPELVLEVGCHSDSRGNDTYNLKLTHQQAVSLRNFLIERGLKPERIIARGYGERYLLNECANNVKCPTEKHIQNRRIELMVVRLNQEQ